MHRKICSSMKIYESMCGEAKSMHKSFGPLSREVPLVVEASVVSAVARLLFVCCTHGRSGRKIDTTRIFHVAYTSTHTPQATRASFGSSRDATPA